MMQPQTHQTSVSAHRSIERAWESFRCRACQRKLFLFRGELERRARIKAAIQALSALAVAGQCSGEMHDLIQAALIEKTVEIEIKCACKTMNYLMGA